MASLLFRSFASCRRLALLIVTLLAIAFILRTPTAPYFDVGNLPPPPVNNKIPRSRLPQEWQEFLKWDVPRNDPEHYPPYSHYADRDYDPNRWEAFPQYASRAENFEEGVQDMILTDSQEQWHVPQRDLEPA